MSGINPLSTLTPPENQYNDCQVYLTSVVHYRYVTQHTIAFCEPNELTVFARRRARSSDMFGTIQRDPMLDLLHHLEHRIDRTFNEPFRAAEWPVPEAVTNAWLPLVDIFEEPDAIRLVAELPGVRPSDVKISVESNLLKKKSTKEQVPEEKAEKVHRYERTYGAFERTFRLSASIDATKIQTTSHFSVLTITLPKAETAKPHLIEVEVTPAKALLNA